MANTAKQRRATREDTVIGERIRIARQEAGMSQADLGGRLGVSFQQIQKYEKGVNRVSLARMLRLASAVNKPLEYFTDKMEKEVKRDPAADARAAFVATRHAQQIIDAMLPLTITKRQAIIDLARGMG